MTEVIGKATFPKIDWSALDLTPIIFATAGDLAALIRKKIKEGQLKPPLAERTVKIKQARGYDQPKTPLYATGMLHDHITHRKAGMNKAEIYIKKRRYADVKMTSRMDGSRKRKSWSGGTGNMKFTNIRWDKPSKSFKPRRAVTTQDVANFHDWMGGIHYPVRPFFHFTTVDFERVLKERVRQGIRNALKRAGAM